MLAKTLLAVAVALSLAGDPKNAISIEGTWTPEKAELGGKPFPSEVRKTMKLVVKGDEYTVSVGEVVDRGTLKLDPKAKPRTIDITSTEGPNKGTTFLAIYERDGDTLRVCYDLSGKDRPTKFETKEGTQLFLVTYKLQKSERFRLIKPRDMRIA